MGQNFPQNRTEFFMGTQETIIYRLVLRNYDFDAFLKKSIFGGKMDVAATLAPMGLGPQDPIRKVTHRAELLGQPLSQKYFLKFKRAAITLNLFKKLFLTDSFKIFS